jgi:hypothetical protein
LSFIYINDIDECVINILLKFADDTKLFGVVANEDMNTMQNDLKNLCSRSKEWITLFSVGNCNVMHMGCNNKRSRY